MTLSGYRALPEYRTEPRQIAVLGASGSIGVQALDIIASSEGYLKACLLAVYSNTQKLVQLACCHFPERVVIIDRNADTAPLSKLPTKTKVYWGMEGLYQALIDQEYDIVLSGIVGSGGLSSLRQVLEMGKTVALANKESLVMAGEQITELLQRSNGQIIPVDSEHSAIFQCLRASSFRQSGNIDSCSCCRISEQKNQAIARLVLTASGGPFRHYTEDQIRQVTVEDALRHPTWKMGPKITIDSATLMNKAFEMIEAHWLFGVESEKIMVVIHPQSLIHSMVEYIDGAVIAQLSPPDMRLPIQLALTFPDRFTGPAHRFDWTEYRQMEFQQADEERYPALAIGREIIEKGGTTGVVVNAVDEMAVNAFLNGKITLDRIVKACRTILDNHYYEAHPTFERITAVDRWARQETEKWIFS